LTPLELAEGDSDPLDTVVESITALIDDTVALSASTPPSRRHSPAPRSTKRGATAFPSSRLSTTIRQIAAINDQIVITVVAADEPAGLAGLTGRFDAVVEATNDPAGAATALALLRRGGTAVLLGISGLRRATIDPDMVMLNQLRVQMGFASNERRP
jgi:hypothetical protein